MAAQPLNWSVVLVGSWNPAILTPAGIARHVYGLAKGTQVQIAVPLDGVSAYLVHNLNETLTTYVLNNRLQIDLRKCSLALLEQGMQCGIHALAALPVTPITAVGFNLNFRAAGAPPELISTSECKIDDKISEQGLTIVGRSVTRTLSFSAGQINLKVDQSGDAFDINCNFHLATQDAEAAKRWLATPAQTVREALSKLSKIVGLPLEEDKNEHRDQPQQREV